MALRSIDVRARPARASPVQAQVLVRVRRSACAASVPHWVAAGEAHRRAVLTLGPFNRRSGGPPARPGGWRFATEVEIYFDGKNTFRPDVAGWRRERLAELPVEVPIRVRPDWICEVLSSNRRNDL